MGKFRVVMNFDETAILCAWFSSILFILIYTLVAPWWKHAVVRSMVALDTGLLIALLPSTLHYLFGFSIDNLTFAWYYACSLFLVSIITLWRSYIVYRIQTKRYEAESTKEEEVS